jgi:hypothetical protein
MAGPVTSNEGQFSLGVGLSSIIGGLAALAFICCLVGYLMKRRLARDNLALQSNLTIIKSNLDSSGLLAMKERANAGSDGSSIVGKLRSLHHMLPTMKSDLALDEKDQTHYAVEFEDILQLMARTETSIKSFVDPHLRNELESKLQNLNYMSPDHAAILQLISRIELDLNQELSSLQTSERMDLLHKRIREGPLTENHSLVLKIICESEFPCKQGPKNEDILPNYDTVTMSGQDFNRKDGPTFDCDTEIKPVEDKLLNDDESIFDVLVLLKRCDLEPSFLSRKESRRLIEDKLINQETPLPADHLAVLQILSKIEVDSDLSMDSERRYQLQKRILDGPLNSKHLCAVERLGKSDLGEGKNIWLMDGGRRAVDYVSPRQTDVSTKAHSMHEISLEAEQHIPVSTESKEKCSFDIISSLEIKSSLFSREEKAVLQLMELRAKTNRIRQSLPDWVRKGLVPPRRGTLQAPFIVSKDIPEHAESCAQADSQAGSGAVLISCEVRADLGFLTDFVDRTVQAPANSNQEVLDGVLLLPEQNVMISEERIRPDAVIPQLGSGLLNQPSGIRAWIAWLASTLSQCLASCLDSLLGSRFKSSRQGQVHGQDDDPDPEPGAKTRE